MRYGKGSSVTGNPIFFTEDLPTGVPSCPGASHRNNGNPPFIDSMVQLYDKKSHLYGFNGSLDLWIQLMDLKMAL